MVKNCILTVGMVGIMAVLAGCEPPKEEKPMVLDNVQIATLIPKHVQNARGWADDIANIFDEFGIQKGASNLCTTIAIIGQESGFSADPAVVKLGETTLKALNEKLEEKFGKKGAELFRDMLATKPSADNSFAKQIKAVRTERQLDELYRKMFAYFSENYKVATLNKLFHIDEKFNPITTLGSMQVHIEYAKAHRRTGVNDNALRDDLYSQYGGLYYGIHRLMRYQADYDEPLYRFADYNSGLYSSRNAAFQAQLSIISGQKLSLDGDLLIYDGGSPSTKKSSTEQAILSLKWADLSERQIRNDLKKEKTQAFEQTQTYQKIKDAYGKKTGKYANYAQMPQVVITSPKLASDKNTAWFANNVNKRYNACMAIAKKHAYPL